LIQTPKLKPGKWTVPDALIEKPCKKAAFWKDELILITKAERENQERSKMINLQY